MLFFVFSRSILSIALEFNRFKVEMNNNNKTNKILFGRKKKKEINIKDRHRKRERVPEYAHHARMKWSKNWTIEIHCADDENVKLGETKQSEWVSERSRDQQRRRHLSFLSFSFLQWIKSAGGWHGKSHNNNTNQTHRKKRTQTKCERRNEKYVCARTKYFHKIVFFSVFLLTFWALCRWDRGVVSMSTKYISCFVQNLSLFSIESKLLSNERIFQVDIHIRFDTTMLHRLALSMNLIGPKMNKTLFFSRRHIFSFPFQSFFPPVCFSLLIWN